VSRPQNYRALHVLGRQIHHPNDEARRPQLPAQRRGPAAARPGPRRRAHHRPPLHRARVESHAARHAAARAPHRPHFH
nr:hypothetical protein [Tanacetum cinerariifolium]